MSLTLYSCGYAVRNKPILHDVSMVLQAGQMTVLMGPSGSGKTTLLRLVGRDISPSSGRMYTPFATEDTGWIPQTAPVIPRRSAIDNVALGALSRGASRRRAQAVAKIAIGHIGLAHVAGRRVSTLSGGERQRVAVARAMSGAARLILADEPSASLDSVSRDAVVAAFRRACDRGATVLLATHDTAVALQADVTLALVDGCLTRVQ